MPHALQPQAADYAAEVKALDRRSRRIKSLAGWIAFGGLLMMSVMLMVQPIDHLSHPGFGAMLHTPPSIAARLGASGLDVKVASSKWVLATDDDFNGAYAATMLDLSCAITMLFSLFRRQWVLAAVAACLLFGPATPLFHKPKPGGELMTAASPLMLHPSASALLSASGATRSVLPTIPVQFHSTAKPPPPISSEPTGVPPAAHVILSLDDVPPASRPDMAYLLAQVAFDDNDPPLTARYYAALGPSYPQNDRVTRARVRVLADYLAAHNILPDAPKPASLWAYPIKQTANGDCVLLVRAALLAALIIEIVGSNIRSRAKRIRASVARLQPLLAA